MIILILIDQLILFLITLALAIFYYVLYPTTSQGYHVVQRLRYTACFKRTCRGFAPETRLRVMPSPCPHRDPNHVGLSENS